ncbi:MAG: hypothetical protein VKJ64_11070 [Leptolyngbyaceae bacterium]|nr:hypothetical protein [Leptolyngbyaceae bacterium]
MQQHVVEICQTLVQAGAIPGADFSVDPTNGGLRLNEEGYRLLNRLYPDVDWAKMTTVSQSDAQAAVESLDQYLGINFVDRILDCIQQRVSSLSPAQAAYYLSQILNGVEHRTGLSLYYLLIQTVDVSRFVYLEDLLTHEHGMVPCNWWIGDLVWAAGGDRQDVAYDGDDAILTENGLRLFELVWAGDNEVYEV